MPTDGILLIIIGCLALAWGLGLLDEGSAVICAPTEAGMPLLEAGKRP